MPGKKEKFRIISVDSPRQDSWLVEIDGGTSFLTARVYKNERGLFVMPTSGWDDRKYDRPTEKELNKILAAIEKHSRTRLLP